MFSTFIHCLPCHGGCQTRRNETSSAGRMMEYLRTNKHFAVASPTMTCVTNATLLGPWQLIKVSFTILAGVWHCKMCMHSLIMDATCFMNLPRCPQNNTRLDRAHHKAGSEATSRRHRTLHKFLQTRARGGRQPNLAASQHGRMPKRVESRPSSTHIPERHRCSAPAEGPQKAPPHN